MAHTDSTAAATGPDISTSPRDLRSFWRILLAVVAVVPTTAKGIWYVLIPINQDADFQDTVASYAAHRSLVTGLQWLDALFMVTLVPAVLAVAWTTRRRAPRLTTAGLLLAGGGLLTGLTLLGGPNTPALLTVQHDLDLATMSKLYDALDGDPVTLAAGGLFLIGIVVGLGLLGGALWRSRVAPAWMGIALMVGGITHPFLPGHVAQGIGLLVASAGFAGATLALLRLRDDEFDLPAVAATRAP
jgi:hypothetical protein